MALSPSKLAQYVKDLGVSYKETSNSFIFNCPLCSGKDKLYIRKSDGRFRCFRCGEDKGFFGAPEYAIIELTNTPIRIAKASLYGSKQEQAGFFNTPIRDFEEGEAENEDRELVELQFPYYFLPIDAQGAKRGLEYLEGRGITKEVATKYNIHYSAKDLAIVFPVEEHGKLYGWQYRTIEKSRFMQGDKLIESPKAWSSPNLPRDRVFMFADRLQNNKPAIITEGPIDCLKVDGLDWGNICTMGKDVSATHVALLLRSGVKTVYAGLDPDAFAQLDPLLSKLGDEVGVYRVNLPTSSKEKIDLGSLPPEIACQRVRESKRMQKNRIYIWLKDFTSSQK